MDDLIGFLIFVAIAAASGLWQTLKARREEAERRQRRAAAPPPMQRREELPEATRRMLYGDRGGNIPTAQPRQQQGAPPFAQPRPRQPFPQPQPQPRPAGGGGMRPPMPAPQPQRTAQVPRETMQRPIPAARPQGYQDPIEGPQRPAPQGRPAGARPKTLVPPHEVRRQQRQTMQQAPRPRRPAGEGAAYAEGPGAGRGEPVYAEGPAAHAAQAARAAQLDAEPAAAPTPATRLRARLAGRAALRDAIVLNELLGPPLALR